ncbi:MAG: AI-2E family transporter [Alphaproteobacteria bacterium]|nr:AI-2E family transporter [Alphaproteobacteria bacterium]MBU2271476.1 AI-2E family transporter [Alphaproteobacteria bacterium]MBU2418474.1 AI-2E family transporter [Alphaproteobacteria bacterium]
MSEPTRPSPGLDARFVHRALFIAGLIVLMAFVWKLATVLLLAFAAVIIAVLVRSLADPIRERTGLGTGLSLILASLTILAVLAGSGWLFGSTVAAQIDTLADRIPRSLAELEALLATLPFGPQLAGQLDGVGAAPDLQSMVGQVSGYVMSVLGAGANLLLVIFAGLFFAAQPGRMRDGLLLLAPPGPREPMRKAANESGRALRLWLMGTLADMVVVGVLTGIGTALIGLPSPVALGLFAGLAAFVPIVGPIVSVVPAVLLALDQGPQMILLTVAVYFIVQQIESNLIYPFIQKRAVDLPPVLTLFGVLGLGTLFGPLGVVFASPLLVVGLVWIKLLYIRNALGEDIPLPGRSDPEPG